MEQRAGQHREFYFAMLRGPRGWQDLYKVEEYPLEIIYDAYE